METRTKIPGLGLILAAMVFAGCLQEPTGSKPQSAKAASFEDPNIAMLVASGIDAADIKVSTEKGDTAYLIEKAISPAEKKKGFETVVMAFRKKSLDAVRTQAQLTKAEQADRISAVQQNLQSKSKTLPAPARAALEKSSQTRWDHYATPWDVKALTEVYQIRVFIRSTGYDRIGPNWIAAFRQAMTNWNNVTGTHVSFVETNDVNNCDLIARGAFSPSGGVQTWMTPDPWVEKDSVDIVFNTGYETVFPHNQKVGFAMIALSNILNITHTNREGFMWNGGTQVLVDGTYNDPNSLFQSAIGPSVNPVFSWDDLRTIRQMYPLNGSSGIDGYNTLWIAGQANNWQIATNVPAFQQVGDTMLFISNNALYMRVGTVNANVLIHSASNPVVEFRASGSHIVVRRANGDIYARTLAGTAAGASWQFKVNIGTSAKLRMDGNYFAYLRTDYGYPVVFTYNLNTNNQVWEWNGTAGQYVADMQISNNKVFTILEGSVYTYDFGLGNYTLIWSSNWGNTPANRLRVSDSHVAIHVWDYGMGTVYTRSIWGGGWTWAWNEAYNPEDFDLCGDKVAVIGQSSYLMLRNASTNTWYYPWSLSNGEASTVRLTGPMCDYVTKVNTSNGAIMGKYSITNATDYFQYSWGYKLFQRP